MSQLNNIAHARVKKDGSWVEHSLKDHLEKTSKKAREFASVFGAGDWAETAAKWHDLGKYTPNWQKYIRKETGYDLDAHIETLGGKVNHSSAGAVLAFKKIKTPQIASILAYPIAGHHAGLPDWYPGEAPGSTLPERVCKKNDLLNLDETDLEKIYAIDDAQSFLGTSLPKSPPFCKQSWKKRGDHLHLWIRMIYSCLVDADFLDTESFMNPSACKLRIGHSSIFELKKRFDLYMHRLQERAPDTPINARRKEILDMCRVRAALEPGFFTLTVPTGGGKTLSSVAFALEHALKHNKRRIIIGIPYTSIIEQTAKVLKFGSDDDEIIKKMSLKDEHLFGEDNVVEHHSNLNPDIETHKNRLASENWDAPVIVTTNVQLFESLLSCRSSSCRKLHNIADSIIILDEAQILPPEYLKPVLSVLEALVENFGVTVVLCTATQPALSGELGSEKATFKGLPECREIVEDPALLAVDFKRVNIHFPSPDEKPVEWEEVAEKMLEHEQCLAIVNTRNTCRTLHSMLPEDAVHLSAFMCGEERSDVINNVKQKLKRGEQIRVVSTQLIEAGVDIDFPVVFRAMAGLDSIAQSAGRCNREGKLNIEGKLGQVYVFNPPQAAPPGLLRKGEDACKSLLRTQEIDNLSPEIFNSYFRKFYSAVADFDISKFTEDLCKEALDFKFQFRSQALKFKLIDNANQIGIVIWYQGKNRSASSHEYIEQLRRLGPNRDLVRKMQRFTVNVPQHLHNKLWELGMIEEISGFYVQRSPGLYREGLGLLPLPEQWCQEFLMI